MSAWQFGKPGASDNYDAGESAIREALAIVASISPILNKHTRVMFMATAHGQKVIYKVGMTGIPVFNVNNNCSTGSSALFMARQAVESGWSIMLAVGFEQMQPGALKLG